MQTGPGKVKIPPGCRLVIRCSKKFTALGLDKFGELKAILGPRAEGDRSLVRIVPHGIEWLKMGTPKTANWSYDVVDRHKKDELDLTPVEIPASPKNIPYDEEIRRIVRTEMSRQAESQGQETFQEADDFDIGDDDPPSPYEMTEMQEETQYSEPKPEPEPKPDPKPEPEPDPDPPKEDIAPKA